MTLRLDHIVIAVRNLEDAITDYQALGFNVQRGGDHPGRSTHNALVVFADGSYFELIAWREPAPQERWWQLLQRHGEGIVDYALLPEDTAATVAAAARNGLRLDGPHDGGRLRPDGERLHWQTARPPSADLPFLCGDITPRALRVPEGEARVHPNGVLGVASLAVAVRDIEATRNNFRALLGTADAHGAARRISPALALPGLASRLALVDLQGSELLLFSPRVESHAAAAAPDAEVQEEGAPRADLVGLRLALRGEGPYAVVLRTGSGGAAVRLDPVRAHGAHLELDDASTASAS